MAPAPASRVNSGKSLNIQCTLSCPHVPTCTHTHTPTRMHTRPHPPPALPSALRECTSERAGGRAGAESLEPAQGPPALGPASAAAFRTGSCLCRRIRRPPEAACPSGPSPLGLPAGAFPSPCCDQGRRGPHGGPGALLSDCHTPPLPLYPPNNPSSSAGIHHSPPFGLR